MASPGLAALGGTGQQVLELGQEIGHVKEVATPVPDLGSSSPYPTLDQPSPRSKAQA